jgi:hypothetical protein
VSKPTGEINPREHVSPSTLERHYSVAEVAKLWNLSEDSVRRLFADEPGVLTLGKPGPRMRKRAYTTLRIPQSVLERVHGQYSLGKRSDDR